MEPGPDTRAAAPRDTRLTLQGWFNLILVIMTLLVVTGSVVGATVFATSAQVTNDLIDRIMPARAAAYQLQSALVNQETGVRGYALTGDATFLAPYQEGLQAEQQSAARMRHLLADHPELLADLDTVEQAARDWQSVFADPLVAMPGRAAFPDDQQFYDRGRDLFDQARVHFDQQNQHLTEVVDEGRAHIDRMRTIRNIVFTALATVLVLAAGVFAVLVRVAVTNPLARLSSSSRMVADGDFDHRVDAGRGPADIRSLATDIEGMRRRIVTELDVVRDRQRQLEDQTRQLDAQTVELRRSNADLEQFAYVASHDLQEPLRKVASFCQLLEKRYGDALDDRGRQYIEFAVDGARRMQTLINDLLAFSRVGRVGSGFEKIALDRPLDKAVANLGSVIEDTGALIDRPDHLPEIDGDPTLLTMLWQNLIGNALKFTRPDTTPKVTITAEQSDGMWRVCVQDNGIGVPEEFAEKIFVIFQRLHAREEYSGTGIGLALCKKIVEYHGGTIALDTTSYIGARFCLTLPVAGEDPIATDPVATVTTEGTRP
ncbi:sensor histidine kinase [Rhodococcus phenolicus]|uniref:sensor histidine kinase n=1 Tax=Rhodococcus phenolicus TaxID=263849 RepID=UPI00082B4307|nr:CHASE3 domain-containing protein [Rhodococcus phenolicus]